MRKEDKALIIERLGEQLKEYAHFYLVDVTGLNAAKTSDLRRQCFKSGTQDGSGEEHAPREGFRRCRNGLQRIRCCAESTTAVLFSDVANAPAKLVKEAGKDTGIPALKAAYAEEGVYVGAEHLDTLCAIKSKAEVLADVVALLQSPAKNVISALSSAGQTVHGVLKTLGERPE